MRALAVYQVAIGLCIACAETSNSTGMDSNDSASRNSSFDDARLGNETDQPVQEGVTAWEKVDATREAKPRFTRDGCLCLKRWRLIGHEKAPVINYCGNPDQDVRGDWCFVKDVDCQPHVNWGYCSPEPRCSVGDAVLAPGPNGQQRSGRLEAYKGQMVEIRLHDEGKLERHDVQKVMTSDGEPCIKSRLTSSSTAAPSPISATPTSASSSTTPIAKATTFAQPLSWHLREALTTTTSTSSEVFMGTSEVREQTISQEAYHRVRFNPDKHGPALALRLDWDYVEASKQRSSIEESLVKAAAAVVQQPPDAIEVLALMRGSVIAALGVVPSACSLRVEDLPSCSEALRLVRQRWEVALWDPNSALRRLLGRVDPMFPPLLNAGDCARRGLPCPWIKSDAGLQNGCGSHRSPCIPTQASVTARSGDRDPWWFMSLIAFAGATPTCLCFGLMATKAFFRLGRCVQRRRLLREVRADACALPRIEVRVEDLHVGEDWVCSICLGELPLQGDLLLLPCKHTLHHDCALEWLERRLTCPMCRSPFRLRDCAIYTTPSLVTPLEPSDAGQADENRPGSRPPSASVEEPGLSPSSAGFQISGLPGAALPNAVDDEEQEEPWWSALPSARSNRSTNGTMANA
mmetsp:Transcript_72454/g.119927  ORF Transcript_72454/g.119927 Transcript_72454/m.119927 type:complete len:633 (+) Transcript_72454:100-1998(+)